MSSPLLKRKVVLLRTLYAANNGIAIAQNLGAHHGIKLGPTQNESAVQFPIQPKNTTGIIEEEVSDQWLVIRLTSSEHTPTLRTELYTIQQVNIMVKKDTLHFFFQLI